MARASTLGVAAGLALTGSVVGAVVPDTFRDVGVVVSLSGGSLVTTTLLGTEAVALAPLLTARRLRRI